MEKPLSKLERVPLREAWKHEAKDANLAGLELADLVVTPIGRRVLGKPDREDYAIVESKYRRAPSGRIDGYGLIVLPKEKRAEPRYAVNNPCPRF